MSETSDSTEKPYSVRCDRIMVKDVVGRLIRNPGYGGPRVSLNGWCHSNFIVSHTKPDFQKALNADIELHGVRNPVVVYCLAEGLFHVFGGSRIKACLEVGVEGCPAIINDYTGKFKHSPEVTPDNWASFFTDPPRAFEFGEYGADYHYNLERARCHDHDPAGFAWLEGEHPDFIAKEFPWLLEEN